MKKGMGWLLPLLVLFALVAVAYPRDAKKLEERSYVMALGFHVKDGKRQVTLESPVLAKDEAESVLEQGQNVDVVPVDRFHEFMENYEGEHSKTLDLHHLKTVVIGREILEDEQEFEQFLRFLQGQNEFSENVSVVVDVSGEGLFDPEKESLGNQVEALLEKRARGRVDGRVSIGRLLSSYYNKNQLLFVPAVSEERTIVGEWAVAGGIPRELLEEEPCRWYLLGNTFQSLEKLRLQDAAGELLAKEEDCSVEPTGVSREVRFESGERGPLVQLRVSLKGKGYDDAGAPIREEERRRSCERRLSERFTEKMQELAGEAAQKGLDLFNTYGELSIKDRQLWRKYQDAYEQYGKEARLLVEVRVSLES